MADVISPQQVSHQADASAPTDQDVVALIELMFFAYRDFVSDPDEILRQFGFGRAHHRVLHFVGRDPGMTVQQLLDILRITKQSLARVLNMLVEDGYVTQAQGQVDRRQRLLTLTEKGEALPSPQESNSSWPPFPSTSATAGSGSTVKSYPGRRLVFTC